MIDFMRAMADRLGDAGKCTVTLGLSAAKEAVWGDPISENSKEFSRPRRADLGGLVLLRGSFLAFSGSRRGLSVAFSTGLGLIPRGPVGLARGLESALMLGLGAPPKDPGEAATRLGERQFVELDLGGSPVILGVFFSVCASNFVGELSFCLPASPLDGESLSSEIVVEVAGLIGSTVSGGTITGRRGTTMGEGRLDVIDTVDPPETGRGEMALKYGDIPLMWGDGIPLTCGDDAAFACGLFAEKLREGGMRSPSSGWLRSLASAASSVIMGPEAGVAIEEGTGVSGKMNSPSRSNRLK